MKFSTFDYFFWGTFPFEILWVWLFLFLFLIILIEDNNMNDKWCMKCRSLLFILPLEKKNKYIPYVFKVY
jgi:hypothetical protein